jgi:hypothetical protein
LSARKTAFFLCLCALPGLAKGRGAFRLQISFFGQPIGHADIFMKIKSVEAFLVSCLLPEPLVLPFYGGVRTVLKRDAMYIRVTADNGLCGFAPGPAHERAEREIREIISPFL